MISTIESRTRLTSPDVFSSGLGFQARSVKKAKTWSNPSGLVATRPRPHDNA
jgi:hypothetical protein